ncbi:MAG: hypothetical protein GQ527_03355 [Bacteroidales bacterium]|nr:hypothetical protein [Bacteroidales bacterium]
MKNIWLIAFVLLIQVGQAQWVDNPATNTLVHSNAGSHYLSKVATNPDGSYYFSWWGGSGNINMNLNYFSHAGENIWGSAVLVSGHAQNSWVDDYNMTSDHEGNAIIVFSDVREASTKNVVAYKLDSEGNQLWGEDGIFFSLNESGDYNPIVVVNEDNTAFVIYSTAYNKGDFNKIIAHKIEADGTLPWGSDGKSYAGISESWSFPQAVANPDGGFSIGFFKETGTFPALQRKIAMIRCDADGNQMWSSPALVQDLTGISAWDDIFIKGDGNGGAYHVWHDDRYFDNMAESYAQYVNPDGETQWVENGVLLSSEAGFFQFYALPAGVNQSGEFVVLWNKVNSNQSMAALMYQRISADGNLLETNYGKIILPLSDQMQNGINAEQMGDTTFYLYNYFLPSSSYYRSYNMVALDATGQNIWGQEVELCNAEIDRSHPNMSGFYENQAVVTWTDDHGIGNRTMAQNIFTDGALGSSPVNIEDVLMDQQQYYLSYNPVSHTILFKDIEANDELKVYNIQGQIIYRNQATNTVQLNKSGNGVFVGILYRNGRVIERFKFVL